MPACVLRPRFAAEPPALFVLPCSLPVFSPLPVPYCRSPLLLLLLLHITHTATPCWLKRL